MSSVIISDAAQDDLFEIWEWYVVNAGLDRADNVIEKLKDACLHLERFPHLGHVPRELQKREVNDYLQLLVGVYRVVYQIKGEHVYIHCIFDGRRDIETLFRKRLKL